MKIAFRVDSSQNIGAGHLMRCLTLAQALKEKKATCVFYCHNLKGNLSSKVTEKGFDLYQVSNDKEILNKGVDADKFLNFLQETRISNVVVDHYQLGSEWETMIRECADFIIAIDDLKRAHTADIVIDPTLGRQPSDYDLGDNQTALCGSQHAIINSEFYAYREQKLVTSNHRVRNLLVSFGGSKCGEVTMRVLKGLGNSNSPHFDEINVIVPCSDSLFSEIKKQCQTVGAKLHDWVDDLPQMMMKSTHAIGAAGGMSWERCTLGIPTILVPIADNQKDNCQALAKTSAVEIVEKALIENQLSEKLILLNENFQERKSAAMKICDGLGARRIAQSILPLKAKDGGAVILRSVNSDDSEIIFKWQNEPDARKYARNKNSIELGVHRNFMRNKLGDNGCHFHIIEHEGQDAGFVRLDRLESGQYEISILVSSLKQKLGIASLALKLADELHKEISILATVLEENEASRTIFQKAGYKQVSDTQYVLDNRA